MIKFIYINIISIFLISCDPMDDKLIIKNNSTDNIGVRFFKKTSSGFKETIAGLRIVPSKSSENIGIIGNWNSEFTRIDTMLIIFYNDYPFLYDKYEQSNKKKCDSLLNIGEYEFIKISYEDLEKREWLIDYPNKKIEKGNKDIFQKK